MIRFSRHPNFVFNIGLKPGEISVLIYLCTCANNQTKVCWPSIETIANHTGMGKTSARQALQKLEQRGLIKIDPHFFKDEKRGKNRQTTNHYTVLCLTDDYYLDSDCKKHQIPNPPPSKSEGQTTILKTTTDDANCCVEYSSTNSNDIDFDKLRSKCINALIEDDQYDTTTISLLYKALNSIWRDETVLVNGTAYSKDQRQKLILDKLSVELLRIAVDSVSESAINVNEMKSFLFRMLIDCEVSI